MKKRALNDGSGILGTCVWCRQQITGMQGIYAAGVVYCRDGECASRYGERFKEFLAKLKAERDAATVPVQQSLFDLAPAAERQAA